MFFQYLACFFSKLTISLRLLLSLSLALPPLYLSPSPGLRPFSPLSPSSSFLPVQITVKNANFLRNEALWGGAVASFSSGGAVSSSSALESGSFLSSASDYDPSDLTPSLSTTGAETTVTSLVDVDAGTASGDGSGDGSGSDGVGGDSSNSASTTTPVKYLDCRFEGNYASEDGGAICKLGVLGAKILLARERAR